MIDVEMLRPTADEMLSGLTAGEAARKRLLFRCEAADRLPEIAGEMLSGLTASPALRHRILVKSQRHRDALEVFHQAPARPARPMLKRLTPAVGMALVVTLMVSLGAVYGSTLPPQGTLGTVQSMGTPSDAGTVPQYRPLFAGEGANPPLIGMNGRYYRMLNSPVPVPPALVDGVITDVTVFSEEPSLMSKVGIVSNVLPVGAKVYSIRDISSKTLCAAEVDGVMRAFQRVSYASMGALDNEYFDDTLNINGMVVALELSGVGVVTNEVDANDLIFLLSEYAIYNGGELSESDQALTIYLQNGLSLQLMVQDDILGGCGTWVCPEFFTEFESALQRAQGS